MTVLVQSIRQIGTESGARVRQVPSQACVHVPTLSPLVIGLENALYRIRLFDSEWSGVLLGQNAGLGHHVAVE